MADNRLVRYIVDEVEEIYDDNKKYYASSNINSQTILTLSVSHKIHLNDDSHYYIVIFYHYWIYLSIFNSKVLR